LFGIIFFAGVLLLVAQFQKHLDIKDGFKDISGFSIAREPRSLIILKDTAYSVKLADVFEDNVQNAGGIPFNKENYKAVVDYIGSKNGFTCDRKVGYEFLVMSKLRELEQSQALETDYGAFSQTGDVFEGMLLVTGIYTSSDKKEYKRILYGITDENHVSINGLAAAKISHVFVRIGDMDKALHWYNKYIETSTNADDRQKELYKPPHMPPFHNGVISGRFLLNGLSDWHVSVGVIKAATSDSMMQYASEHGGKSNIWNLINLADGTITDSEGRFTFTGLGEDEYVLLLSLGDVPGKKYRVINSPGAIRVSENNPSVDVGSIDLELEPAKPEKL